MCGGKDWHEYKSCPHLSTTLSPSSLFCVLVNDVDNNSLIEEVRKERKLMIGQLQDHFASEQKEQTIAVLSAVHIEQIGSSMLWWIDLVHFS